ncbi:hypothetical protein JCM10213_000032 [Rhodosporidiobolus nylandii]
MTQDDSGSGSPPPPPPPRRSYAAASSAQQPAKSSSSPPPVPPKPSSAQSSAHSPVAPASFFGASSSSTPPADRRSSGSGGQGAFRPAGSAKQRRSSNAQSEDVDMSGSGSGQRERARSSISHATSAVREAAEDVESQGAWKDDPWGGNTWNQQLVAAHNRPSSAAQQPTVSPHFVSQHIEHALPDSPNLSAVNLPPLPDEDVLGFNETNNGVDGRYTVPRIIALPDNQEGGFAGLWKDVAWDFDLEKPVLDTPENGAVPGRKGIVYRAMGEAVQWSVDEAEAAESNEGATRPAGEAAGEDTPMPEDGALEAEKPLPPPVPFAAESDPAAAAPAPPSKATPPPAPPKPVKGFSTPSRAELSSHLTRPHPHLYFCRTTLSWALFAPLPPGPAQTSTFGSAASPASDDPELFEAQAIPPHEAEAYLAENLQPPLHAPMPPAAPELFSGEMSYAPWTPATAAGGLLEVRGSKGTRAVVSTMGWYPSVVGTSLWQRLLNKRGENPLPGKSEELSRWTAVRLIWRAIDGLLFVGETLSIPSHAKAMKAMPMDDVTNDLLFATLGWKLVSTDNGLLFEPPVPDERTPAGRATRARLLRAWFELGAWLEKEAIATPETGRVGQSRVNWKPAQARLAEALGGDKLARRPASTGWQTVGQPFKSSNMNDRDSKTGLHKNAPDYTLLGLTPDLADEVVEKVYDLQMMAEESKGPMFLEALTRIAQARDSETLQTKLVLERSKERYSQSEVRAAYMELRLPDPFDSYSRIPTEDEILGAFDARNTAVEHPERRKVLLESARVVASHAKSETLKAMLESLPAPMEETTGMTIVKAKMDPVRAYAALGVEAEIDDEMLLMIYGIRLDDASNDSDKEKAREALEVIADERKSEKLRAFLNEGKQDSSSGWQAPTLNKELPVGLTNIANTCYLNSLLQFFFTVRELRETILSFDASAPTPPFDGEGAGDALQIRVGGRLVSEKEVRRSKKFVALLQSLYTQLIHSSTSVTPETELAYLALVPSKEEEAFNAPDPAAPLPPPPASTTAETSRKVDEMTLSSPGSGAAVMGEEVKSPGGTSVLGKRKNGAQQVQEGVDDMVIDSQPSASPLPSPAPAGDAEMADASADSAAEEGRIAKRGRSLDPAAASEASSVTLAAGEGEGKDEEMQPPALPPRPREEEKKEDKVDMETQVSSYMAFGRQNDVTECMDNVMFQVEAALLASAAGKEKEQDEQRAGLLKRTFYGHTLQTLTFTSPPPSASTSSSSLTSPFSSTAPRTQLEPFSSLLVDVPASPAAHPALQRDLYDALDATFAPQVVELEGREAVKRVALVAGGARGAGEGGKKGQGQGLPTLLQVQLQRVQFDRERGRVFKSNEWLGFPEEVDVRRYCAPGDEETDEEAQRRRRTDALRAELESRRARLAELVSVKVGEETSPTSAPALLRSTLSHLSSLTSLTSLAPSPPSSSPSASSSSAASTIAASTALSSLTSLLTPSLTAQTTAEADALENEIQVLEARVGEIRGEVEALWAAEGGMGGEAREKGEGKGEQGEEETRYELCSVFIHRGTALSGHYYIYQRDSRDEKKERWLKYNDSLVTTVPKGEVFKPTNSDTNPYFLVYVRKDRLDAIESIKREDAAAMGGW